MIVAIISFVLNVISISPARAQRVIARLKARVDKSYGLRQALLDQLDDDLHTFETHRLS